MGSVRPGASGSSAVARHNQRMGERDRPSENEPATWQGLPQTVHDPVGPAGQIEQVGRMVSGREWMRGGWRRVVVVVGLVLLAVLAVTIGYLVVVSPGSA